MFFLKVWARNTGAHYTWNALYTAKYGTSYKWNHTVCVFCDWFISFNIMPSYAHCSMCQNFLTF